MELSFKLSKGQLKMFAAICANLVVVWLAAVIATHDLIILTRNFILVIVFWYLGVKAEELMEEI